MTFHLFDIDLHQGTLILKLNIDINEVPICGGSKLIARTDRQTNRQTDTDTQTSEMA